MEFPPWKRARVDVGSEENHVMNAMTCMSWRLPLDHTLEQNQQSLNDQLQQLSVFHSEYRGTTQCRVDFASILTMIQMKSIQDEGLRCQMIEHTLRDSMDVINWLLVLRQHATFQQNDVADTLRQKEKELERKQQQYEELETKYEELQQQLVTQENGYKKREQVLGMERKKLQQDKKQLEIIVSKLQGQETAFKAHLRRKEKEYERLKKRLQEGVTKTKNKVR